MNNDITAIILAAGLGTRMKSSKAKVLHEAGGDNLLNHVIRAALACCAGRADYCGGRPSGRRSTRRASKLPASGSLFSTNRKGPGTPSYAAAICAVHELACILILNGDGPLLRPKR